jgi:hypothetical protein
VHFACDWSGDWKGIGQLEIRRSESERDLGGDRRVKHSK